MSIERCTECDQRGFHLTGCSHNRRPPSPPERKVPDPSPSIGIQHRCIRMVEHLPSDGLGRPGTRDGLPVPCSECYSIVVTCVAIPWQPNVPDRSIP